MVPEKKAAELGAVLRRIERLLRVLVVGGAAIAASCASVPRSGDGSASSGAESKGKEGKEKPPAQGDQESGTGVRGW